MKQSGKIVFLAIMAAFAVLFASGCDLNYGSGGEYAPPPPQPIPSDPPARVGRLSYLNGPVSFRAAGSTQWTPAVLNRPVTTGDELWTGAGARAELHLGFAAIRLDAHSDFGVLELSSNAFQAKLTQGIAVIRLHALEHGDAFEIDTPHAAFTPSYAGEYRIEASANRTALIAREGAAEVTNPRGATELTASHRVVVRTRGRREIGAAAAPDGFDQLCQLRDRAEERAESKKYLPAGVVGGYDLDDCGIWLTSPAWGSYWTPRCVPVDWAPYRFGRWAWIEPWGWSWIDDMPWGFAPFHYGRWVRMNENWSWVPAPYQSEPVYAPALVAFARSAKAGTELSEWLQDHGVAWFPLGPKEVYVPAYRSSVRHLIALNPIADDAASAGTAKLIQQPYANRAAKAITAVSREAFLSGRPIGKSAVSVDARDAGAIEVTACFPPLAPTVSSLSGPAPAGVDVAKPAAEISSRTVVSRRPAPDPPVPFESRLPRLQSQPGKPMDRPAENVPATNGHRRTRTRAALPTTVAAEMHPVEA